MSQQPMNQQLEHLNFLEKFILEHYSAQPPWVRTFTFVIFVLLLVYAIYRMVGGEFSLSGELHQPAQGGGSERASGYDVKLGQKRFGTNFDGAYYIVLGPRHYISLMATGQLTVDIWKEKTFIEKRPLAFSRINQEFERIEVKLLQEGGVFVQPSQRHAHSGSAASLSDLLVIPAQADPVQGGDRLFVEVVELKPGLPSIKEGALELQVSRKVLKLRSARTREVTATPIPLVSGEKFVLETDYYFEIPPDLPSAPSGEIKLTAKGRLFSSYAETFEVSLDRNYGDRFSVPGDQKSQVSLLRLTPYDVMIYEKKDLIDQKDRLKAQFIQAGYRVVDFRSPLGYDAETNALFGGKKVPYQHLQKILAIVRNQGIKIKTVQYQLNLRSGNPYEIQLGGSAAFNNKNPLPDDLLRKLESATGEEEFKALL
jgi:hypothetical protein